MDSLLIWIKFAWDLLIGRTTTIKIRYIAWIITSPYTLITNHQGSMLSSGVEKIKKYTNAIVLV